MSNRDALGLRVVVSLWDIWRHRMNYKLFPTKFILHVIKPFPSKMKFRIGKFFLNGHTIKFLSTDSKVRCLKIVLYINCCFRFTSILPMLKHVQPLKRPILKAPAQPKNITRISMKLEICSSLTWKWQNLLMYVQYHFLLLSLLKTRSLLENYECKSLKCSVKSIWPSKLPRSKSEQRTYT